MTAERQLLAKVHELLAVHLDDAGPPPEATELLTFARKYLAHYFQLPPSLMHKELAAECERMLASPDVERLSVAAPRGNAKTTLILAFFLWCVVYGRKRFCVYITSTAELADAWLADLKHELEANEELAADFPAAVGRGAIWRENVVVTRNDIRVLTLGAQKKIRGRKHREVRPDLIVLDDLENDEHVRNVEQRDKMQSWLTKAVLPARGVNQKADFILAGTVLHFDSVLARCLDARRSPGWRSRRYRAVIDWSPRQDLWQEWERLYTDWHQPDDVRMAAAAAFFETHRDAMLAGTSVLWPEGEPYYTLMRQRIDDGPTSFASEKQNEPLDPTLCDFPEEWFCWFTEIEQGGEWMLVPEQGDGVRLADCDVFCAVDPSMGKLDRNSDPSALVSVAAYPSQRLPTHTGRYSTFWVLDADIRRRHPHVITEDLLTMHRLRRFERVGVEAIQFQELFAEDIQAKADVDPTLRDFHTVKLKPHSDKRLRIQKLGPLIHSRRMRFARKLTALYDQLRYFPHHAHDDGPDALELCLEVLGEIGWVMLDIAPPEAPAMKPANTPAPSLREAANQQIKQQFAQHLDRSEDLGTCGECLYLAGGRCSLRGLLVEAKDPGCDAFDLREEE